MEKTPALVFPSLILAKALSVGDLHPNMRGGESFLLKEVGPRVPSPIPARALQVILSTLNWAE